MLIQPPKRNDDARARHWRGPLFGKLRSPIMWRDKWLGYYEMLEAPRSVTFPICDGCGHIIWDWPHFEEAVPDRAVCDQCFKEDQEANERDNNR